MTSRTNHYYMLCFMFDEWRCRRIDAMEFGDNPTVANLSYLASEGFPVLFVNDLGFLPELGIDPAAVKHV